MNQKSLLLILFIFITSFPFLISAETEQEKTYQLSTHILDIDQGKPAPDVSVTLFKLNINSQNFEKVDEGITDKNGRIASFLPIDSNNEGIYKLKFETLSYFTYLNKVSIYPFIEVVFTIEGDGHYHIPITVSANGYSTYRGN